MLPMEPNGRLWLREIVSAQDPMLEQCRELYVASFPVDERVPEESFVHMLERRALGKENYESQPRLVIALQGDKFAGFCSFSCMLDMKPTVPEHVGAIFYMAVPPKLWHQGLGQFMFRTVQSIMAADAQCRRAKPMGLLLEVERFEDGVGSPDRMARDRRIKFYERLGCRLLKRIDYVQPALEADRKPLHLNLMAGGELVNRSDRHICRLWYRLVFGLQDDDPVVLAAAGPVGG